MALNVNEISEIIKKQIKEYSKKIKINEEGTIITIGDGIALINGLDNVMMNELLIFPNEIYGIVLNLEEDVVGVVLMGDDSSIREGDKVKRSGKIVETPVGNELLGRVVNSLGKPIDGKGQLKAIKTRPVERIAPGVMTRKSIDEPLETGIMIIDSMIPIGKGQRELIIGDRQTGKTSICIDIILNQKGKNIKCIYVAIGQKASTVAQIVEKLRFEGSLSYTTIVSSTASELASLQYLAPYTGIAIGEEWMESGEDVIIIYDDLSKHAIAYRTMALLLHRPPGREAYPGDIFYLHSRLLERSARLTKEYGGGSITAFPIIETQEGDISSYIPTNVISITDGQIFLNNDQFNSGVRPAVDVGLSVSRVGSTAQIEAMKQVACSLKLELAQYRELQTFNQFGFNLDNTTKQILEHGKRVIEILKQKQYSPFSQINQVIILLSIKKRRINWIPINKIQEFKEKIIKHFNTKAKKYYNELTETKKYNKVLMNKIDNEIIFVIKDITNTIKNYNPELFGKIEEWNKLEKNIK